MASHDELKNLLITKIETLIELKLFSEAKAILAEYDSIHPDDLDIYSIKIVIAINEGNFAEAEDLAQKGLLIDSRHPELLFNLAYIYESQGRLTQAVYYYRLAKSSTDKSALHDQVDVVLDNLYKRITGLKVVIVAFEKHLEALLSSINTENIEISAVLTLPTNVVLETINKQNKRFSIYPYWQLKEVLNSCEYDFVIICDGITDEFNGMFGNGAAIEQDLLKYGVPKNKIINQIGLYASLTFHLANTLKYYLNTQEQYRSFITGLSYAEVGIDLAALSFPSINFAYSSQDLFFDYEIAKLVLQKPKSDLKYAIIGLAPYSFHYDLSLSNERHRVTGYYPSLGKSHNYNLSEEFFAMVFNDSYKRMFEYIPAELQVDLNKNVNNTMGLLNYIKARSDAELWNEKSYMLTVRENTRILFDYISLCNEQEVRPIVVLFPFTQLWCKFFSREKIDELYSILALLKKQVCFDFLDYYGRKEFTDEDFYDVQHLNARGAKKLSMLIDNDIKALL